jgi:hypothetical protein
MAIGRGSLTVMCAGSGRGLTALPWTDRASARCAVCGPGANTTARNIAAEPRQEPPCLSLKGKLWAT